MDFKKMTKKALDQISIGVAFLFHPMMLATVIFFLFLAMMVIDVDNKYESSKKAQESPEFSYKTFCVDGKKAYYLHDRYENRYQFFLTDDECDTSSSKKVEEKK